ncbi:hypothetical protein LTS18_008766 [Coniosporium uncinatum]|uniref:Uncharacterized protein n=1 Tax=Coniosporium uncinatum TaxID=93489 RepID=A0ACC3DMZ8_9PEZI|nr:hypothetical protein LTS18_008766 [Coniosporium uncinatum]
MGRELQKKKRRSGLQKVKRKPKSKKTLINNPIIAENWDNRLTVHQNFKKLGLAADLHNPTGGVERNAHTLAESNASSKRFAINPKLPTQIQPGEARIKRDLETGEVHVIEAKAPKPNPLNDPLLDMDKDEEEFEGFDDEPNTSNKTDVVKQLEVMAANEAPAKPRKQSEREQEWIQRLVEKHGDDCEAMFRDTKLNVMQQSVGDIKKRVKKWKAGRAA